MFEIEIEFEMKEKMFDLYFIEDQSKENVFFPSVTHSLPLPIESFPRIRAILYMYVCLLINL